MQMFYVQLCKYYVYLRCHIEWSLAKHDYNWNVNNSCKNFMKQIRGKYLLVMAYLLRKIYPRRLLLAQ